jgi:hypothetical protein
MTNALSHVFDTSRLSKTQNLARNQMNDWMCRKIVDNPTFQNSFFGHILSNCMLHGKQVV